LSAPAGQSGPITQAAIRDYQRMAGLDQTGEVSEALFDSLKEMAAMVFPKAARAPD
jgi:peptidoglycan hydrolase-like protein with peptidoglycan-binding domain